MEGRHPTVTEVKSKHCRFAVDVVSPGVDIVIVTHNSAHVVGDLLDSVPVAVGDVSARIVVVDNGSSDGTVPLLLARGGCKVVQSENNGYSAGINRGVSELDGDSPILVLNPDVRLGRNSVVALLGAMAAPATGIVAPMVRNVDGSLNYSLRREPTLLRACGLGFTGRARFSEYVVDGDVYESQAIVDWVLGAAMLVSRQCHEELSGWDESFFLYSEETDLCLRARERGWLVRYEPRAVVTHMGGESGRSPKIHSMQIINRVRLYARRHGRAASWMYFGLTLASEASWVVRGHRQSVTSLYALMRPSRRPKEIGCSQKILPS